MTETVEILDGIAELVNEISGVDTAKVTENASFVDDLDVDSLSMVEIIYACEEKFGVSIPDEESKNLKTVGDAVNFIQAAQAA